MSQNSSTDSNKKDNSNNKMVSPFGVVLKSTGGPRKSSVLVKTVDNNNKNIASDNNNNNNDLLDSSTQSANGNGSSSNIDWSQRRQSLRRVEPPPSTVSSSKTRGAALAARHDPQTNNNPRQKLRRVPSEEKRRKPPPKRDSREIKAPWSVPFTLSASPTFGVVLRKVSRSTKSDSSGQLEQVDLKKTTPAEVKKETSPEEDDDDQFLDLDFRPKAKDDATAATVATAEEDSTAAAKGKPSTDTPAGSNFGAPFGVRLKPTRRANFAKKSVSRIYQIDLKPTIRKMIGDNTYESSSRAFLEIELKPVLQKRDKDGNAQGPQMVEMHLRHIVSPEDGGPKRTVTTASFTIPMLHHIDLNATEQERMQRQHQECNALQDLLQLTISSLKHVPPREPHDYPEPQLLQIQLDHVNPTTKEIQPLGHSIQIELKPPPEKDAQPRGALPPSMLVSLKHVDRNHLTTSSEQQASEPEFLNVKFNSVKVAEEEFSEPAYDEEELFDLYPEDEYEEYDEEEVEDGNKNQPDEYDEEVIEDGKKQQQQQPDEYDEEVLDDDEKKKPEEIVDEYEIEELVEKNAQKPRNLRSSLPNLVLEDMPLTTETSQPKEEDTTNKEKTAARQDKDDKGRKARSTRRAPPQRQRSSSLSDMDRARIRAAVDKADERKFAKEEAARKLSKKKQRDLLMWYNRMKTPTREEMKRRVAKLPESCDITPEDVDALPWLCRGRFLDLKVMNQLFLEDWQGVKKDDDDSDSD